MVIRNFVSECAACGFLLVALICCKFTQAQGQKKTGSGMMPNQWIDSRTGHQIVKLLHYAPGNEQDPNPALKGDFKSFYFHNNPFVGDLMIFYGTTFNEKDDPAAQKAKRADGDARPYSRQIYTYNFKTGKVSQLTHAAGMMSGEIVSKVNHEAYYQIKDTVFGVEVKTGATRVVFVFPKDYSGSITTVNADGSLLGGVHSTKEEAAIYKKYPGKHDYFNRIYEARLPRTLLTISLKTGQLQKVFSDSAWLNHVQFSPTDPNLLMFCHEGPWHKVDRIWTINLSDTQPPVLIHKRSMEREIAGHEWFSSDGKFIWFDLQMPRGEKFLVGGVNLLTQKETRFNLTRDEWSVHYTSAWDQKTFAGDGGGPRSVANAKDGKWIYLFRPAGDRFVSEKLVDMSAHDYQLEPNLHYSPDGKWIIFRANFEGHSDIYAARIQK
ncbi:MAG TPA: oligogalacturonate lyase family protein [Arachidicoccus sp.]|nr:oligogalacturonate lyase family protein [Arachidicoccus sp.]